MPTDLLLLSDVVEPPLAVPVGVLIAITVAWFLALGACVGSFLNVVVYRLPLGLKLSSPGSRCPVCETPILRRDNVPVFGWMWLRGRCRSCLAPISIRYPLVEAFVAGAFVVLLLVEVSSGGANLPVRPPNAMTGLVWTLWSLQWELIGLYLYHITFVALLVSAALIAFDGDSIRRLAPRALVLGFLPPIVWPHLHPVPFVVPLPEWLETMHMGHSWEDGWLGSGQHVLGLWLSGTLDGLAGGLSGLLLGLLMRIGVPTDRPRERFNVVATATFVGVFLGWQAAWSVGWLASPLWLALASTPRRRDWATVGLCLAAAAQLVLWRTLSDLDLWPSHRGVPTLGSLGWAVLPVVPLLTALIVRRLPAQDAVQEKGEVEPAASKPADEEPPADS